MHSPLCDVARKHQRHAHQVMPDRERDCRLLLLGERQELRGKFADHAPARTMNNTIGSSGGSPSASACSISNPARSTAALVSDAAYPLTCMSACMSAT